MVNRINVEGLITALITPFDNTQSVKEDALRRLVRFQLQERVNGFFPCGTTGQGPLMTLDERKRVAEIVVEETKHTVPVIVQIGTADTKTTVLLARHAESIGAEAIACVAPYYYQSDDEALVRHYETVAKSVSLPVFVYNIPRHTGVNIKPELLLKLAKTNTIIGVKDSTRDFLQLIETIETLPKEFIVINGSEGYLLPALIMGAKGAVSALASALPELFTGLYEAFKKGDLEKAKSLQVKLNKVKRISERPPLAPIFEILRERGIDCGNPRAPLRTMTAEERSKLVNGLRSFGLL